MTVMKKDNTSFAFTMAKSIVKANGQTKMFDAKCYCDTMDAKSSAMTALNTLDVMVRLH